MDREEFERWASSEGGRLRLLAGRLAGTGLDPEDLLQDTLKATHASVAL